MIFNLYKIKNLVTRNSEIGFLFVLLIFTILSTTFYNDNKKKISENQRELLNNVYFQKSLNYIFDNLSPKYKIIEHKVSKYETFYKILRKYNVIDNEIFNIRKILEKSYNLNNLKTD